MSKPSFPSYPLPPTQKFTVAPNVTLAYSLTPASSSAPAQNSPVVLAQGWTGVKEDWYALVPFLASLGHPVLVFDHRGFGESSSEIGKERYTLELLADDAAKLIRGVFKGEKVHFMGISSQ
jgi:pimeloyl-ACP methyl ester carboxylesterase